MNDDEAGACGRQKYVLTATELHVFQKRVISLLILIIKTRCALKCKFRLFFFQMIARCKGLLVYFVA